MSDSDALRIIADLTERVRRLEERLEPLEERLGNSWVREFATAAAVRAAVDPLAEWDDREAEPLGLRLVPCEV